MSPLRLFVLAAACSAAAACQTAPRHEPWLHYEPSTKICEKVAKEAQGNADVIVDMQPQGGCNIAHMLV